MNLALGEEWYGIVGKLRDAIRKTNKYQLQYKESNLVYRHKKWGWDGSVDKLERGKYGQIQK